MRIFAGGAGRYPGGDGVVRELLFRKNFTLSVLTERRVFQPYGLAGGSAAARGRNTVVNKLGRKVSNLESMNSLAFEHEHPETRERARRNRYFQILYTLNPEREGSQIKCE